VDGDDVERWVERRTDVFELGEYERDGGVRSDEYDDDDPHGVVAGGGDAELCDHDGVLHVRLHPPADVVAVAEPVGLAVEEPFEEPDGETDNSKTIKESIQVSFSISFQESFSRPFSVAVQESFSVTIPRSIEESFEIADAKTDDV
jgi:hypothetical protein